MMLQSVIPKLPMRNKDFTKSHYVQKLQFDIVREYPDYLLLSKDKIEIHFFLFKDLDPKENYGQVYIRTVNIEDLYQSFIDNGVEIHPNGKLRKKSLGTNGIFSARS
ncbi:VOC family protein [Kaistella carnis]|uniref:VOC family protein n=1 Tax=Kaistella carnis TaxID=1241979 RepID=UPI002939478C|nr:VOC family protein [Kaistella carnis]